MFNGYTFRWDLLWQARDSFALGVLIMAGLSLAAWTGAAIFGLLLAYASRSRRRMLARLAAGWVDVARATPLLVLVFVVYLVLPEFGILRGLDAGTTFVLALSAIGGGYICEDLRAAFASLPQGMADAADALGLHLWQREVAVMLPAALRRALPALTTTTVGIVKDTSVASIIAVPELTFAARELSTNQFRVFEGWLTAAALYLALTALLGAAGRTLEHRFAVPGVPRL